MGWDRSNIQTMNWIGLVQFANVQPGGTLTQYCEQLADFLPRETNETKENLSKKLEDLHGLLVKSFAALESPPLENGRHNVVQSTQKEVVVRCCEKTGITEEQKSALSLQMWRELGLLWCAREVTILNFL